MQRATAAIVLCLTLLAACAERSGETTAAPVAADPRLTEQAVDWLLPSRPGAVAPTLSATGDGRLLLSWVQLRSDGPHALRFAVWDPAAGRWQGAPRTIAQGTRMLPDPLDAPQVRAAMDGTIWAQWSQQRDGARDVRDVVLTRSRDGGANWIPPHRAHDDDSDSVHGFANLWSHGVDQLGAAWLDGRGHARSRAMQLRTALFDPASRRYQRAMIDTRVCGACRPAVAMTAAGPLLAYRGDGIDGVRDVLVTRLRGSGGWTAPRRVHTDGWQATSCPAQCPALAARGRRAAAAWYTEAGIGPGLQLAASNDSGTRFSAPLLLDSATAAPGQVALALDDVQLRVLWLREEDGVWSLWYARYSPGLDVAFQRTELARLTGGGDTGSVQLVVRDGVAHAVWTDVEAGRPVLRALRIRP